MDDTSSASELSKKVTIFNAILWLKNEWDAVVAVTIERCFAKRGFVESLVGTADEGETADIQLSSEMETILTNPGMTWDDYANFDKQLATCQVLEKDWETNLIIILREEQSLPILDVMILTIHQLKLQISISITRFCCCI